MIAIPPALSAALADRYRLDRELGHGGMATVYLAHDLKHDRQVALKVLRPELAAVLGAERFLAEIRTTANLQHPHILPLFDSGIIPAGHGTEAVPYYVMPFIEGESLRDRLTREKQLPIADAVRIATEVASALDYAHRHGVIHRDIKPENILLHDGNAVVADFGIALAVDAAGGQRLTETGLAVGTPHYMSPEQSMAERELDGRSDLYALGCVLYEMLAGEPPYTGPTAQAVIAKRMTHPVPSVRALRETVPESVDRALVSALAKSPSDRFATARDFAEALGGTAAWRHDGGRSAGARSTAVPSNRRTIAIAVTVLLALVATWVAIDRRRRPRPALDANLIAIAPFDVIEPALEVWREGVVDLLSRTLDGAGSLRTVSPSVVLRGWQGRSDRASATALAHRAGAGLAATGSLSRRGADSVELRASLLDVGRASVIGEVRVIGTTARVGELVDSLGLEILRVLSRDRPVAAVRQAAIGSAPLPALKAFLRGEQFYRRSLYDSALVAYNEAIAGDSNFAMAWYRMGLALGWDPPTKGVYGDNTDYLAQAHTRNHGLSARDSLLIAADSVYWVASGGPFGQFREAITRLELAAQRFPGDPEVWYALGEAREHAPFGFGGDPSMAFAAFDRALALDPGFGPAYEHILGLALQAGQPDRAFQYARAAISLEGTDQNSSSVRLASRLLLASAGEGASGIARQLDSAKPVPLFSAGVEVFSWWPDSNETEVLVLRRLASLKLREGESDDRLFHPLMPTQYLAWALAFRGHLREAYLTNRRLIEDPTAAFASPFLDPFLGLALLGAVPDDIAARAFRPSLEQGVAVHWRFNPRRALTGLPWWAMKQDTAALALFGRRMGEAAGRASSPEDGLRARYLQAASAGYLALVRGDSATALRRFSELPDTLCAYVPCFYQKLTEAALLAARGEDLRAAGILDAWLADGAAKTPVAVAARLDRARIAERLHDRETAIRSYQFVVDAWRRADPELQPYVAQAKEGLARLVGEPR